MTSDYLESTPSAGAIMLDDLFRTIAYHWFLVLFVAMGTVVCTYAAFQFIPDQYVSTARLLVKLGRENVELPVTVEKGGLLSTGVRKEEINSEIQLLDSRPMIEATVDTIGLDAFKLEPPPPVTWFQAVKAQMRAAFREVRAQIKETLILLNIKPRLSKRDEIILDVQRALTVERERDSDVIAISVRMPSADLAMKVADTLVKLYLDRRLEVRRDRGMSDFFDEQLNSLRRQLSFLDGSKLRLRDTTRVSAMNEERALLMSRLQSIYSEMANDERELRLLSPASAATAVRKPSAPRTDSDPQSPGPATPLALTSFPNLEQLRSKITELRLRRTDLLQKFNEGSEPVERIDREVVQIELTLRQAIGLQFAERKAVANSIEQRLQALNASELGLEAIERDRTVINQHYQTYSRRREEARVSEALDLRRVSNIAVLADADKPLEPVYPRKVLILALALPFGLLAGLGIALMMESLNQTIRDERDLSPIDRGRFLGMLRAGRR